MAASAAAASTDKFFASDEYPTCEVKADGHMYIKYHRAHALHQHFACTHAAGGACSCDGHPTHGEGGCRQMIMNTGKKIDVGGNCVTLPITPGYEASAVGASGLGALLNAACSGSEMPTIRL
eukprot:g3456.t1